MGDFSQYESISKLKLSTRAQNTLNRAGIFTIEEFLNVSREEIGEFRSCGKKTQEEFLEAQKNLVKNGDFLQNDQKTNQGSLDFLGEDGLFYHDVSISDLGLSVRGENVLRKAGKFYASEVLAMSEDELNNLPQAGIKTIVEIRDFFQKYSFRKKEDQGFGHLEMGMREKLLDLSQEWSNLTEIPLKELQRDLFFRMRECQNKEECDSWIDDFASFLKAQPSVQEFFRKILEKTLDKHCFSVETAILVEELPPEMQEEQFVTLLLRQSLALGKSIENQEGQWEIVHISVLDYIETLEKEETRDILRERVGGKTLGEIGDEFDLTRERVRQVVKKYLERSPVLYEDRFRFYFEKYYMKVEDFVAIFQVPAIVYHYLNTRYVQGKVNIREMEEDSTIPQRCLRIVQKILYRDFVFIAGRPVRKNKDQIIQTVSRLYGKEGMTLDELRCRYEEILEELDLDQEEDFHYPVTTLGNKMNNNRNVLWKNGKKFRYYNIDLWDYSNLFKELDLEQYENISISTLKLFRSHGQLMEEYDVRDEYELHNLLKKVCQKEDYPGLKFGKMPMLEFGDCDRELQMKQLFLTLSPISPKEFGEAYEEEYGMLSSTVQGMPQLRELFEQEEYRARPTELPDDLQENLAQVLTADFFTLEQFKRIVLKISPDSFEQVINPVVLRGLGYSIYQNYLVSTRFRTAVEYFRFLIFTEDLLDISAIPREITKLQMFQISLNTGREQFEIFEYAPQKFIHFRKLERLGVTKEQIQQYCRAVYAEAGKYSFFTVKYLQKKGFSHQLDDLGFDEWFYATILSSDKSHFTCQRMGKSKVLSTKKSRVSQSNVIEEVVLQYKDSMIERNELVALLLEDYGLTIDPYTLVEVARETNLYYDDISDKIFRDYDAYYAEI